MEIVVRVVRVGVVVRVVRVVRERGPLPGAVVRAFFAESLLLRPVVLPVLPKVAHELLVEPTSVVANGVLAVAANSRTLGRVMADAGNR